MHTKWDTDVMKNSWNMACGKLETRYEYLVSVSRDVSSMTSYASTSQVLILLINDDKARRELLSRALTAERAGIRIRKQSVKESRQFMKDELELGVAQSRYRQSRLDLEEC